MGAGGDGRPLKDAYKRKPRNFSFDKLDKLQSSLRDDLTVLRHMWFSKAKGSDHAARLENFYGPQAQACGCSSPRCSHVRALRWSLCALLSRRRQVPSQLSVGPEANAGSLRSPACGQDKLDLGGPGRRHWDYMPLENFSAIYVVDLCHSLCEVAKKKVKAKGWKNVHVIEGDACQFAPPEGTATLVTFSYSLSMIPPFLAAVDQATSYLDLDGILGVADFYVSSRYDLPMRQMGWLRRFFWRATFDTDNIDIGPERRAYLENRLERVWEVNSQGSIPYVPYLRAPYYVWIGRHRQLGHPPHENKVDRPALFPPTFLYTQSWEDPEPDMQVMDINPKDTVLTLTSGGCNALNLLLHGAAEVVSVDCNPAQTALLELKAVAIQQLDFENTWQLFGEGVHPHIEQLFEKKLSPFLSQTSNNFWSSRLWYFHHGLYYQGGMGKLCWVLQCLAALLGYGKSVQRLANAPSLEEQQRIWDEVLLVRFIKHGPRLLVWIFCKVVSFLLFNRLVLWFGGGVPGKQYELIKRDNIPIENYIARTMDGVAEHSHLRKQNYFYYNCLTGKFLRDNCPSYLKEAGFRQLKAGAIERLTVATGTFMDELKARMYTKHGPRLLVWIFCKVVSFLLFNRLVLWFGGGVPGKQYELIKRDNIPIENYIARTMDGVAEHSHLRKQNYFYYNCLTGKFLRDNCPSYLKETGFRQLKAGAIEGLTVATGTFMDELKARMYTKVILMDHLDWMQQEQHEEYARALACQVAPGGIVIWRSAANVPPYAEIIRKAGFDVRCISRADQGYMDRVNMYSSFYVAKRKAKND
ncbi:uncharacterized protein HaLaN_07305, partial [Haematococcus lacustris]